MISFWGINFHIYGFILGIGILAAREVIVKVAKERKLDENLLDKIFIAGVVGGIIGARLYHVLDNFTYYSENVVKIFLISEGGLGIWGAVIGGISAIALKWRIDNGKWKIREITDLGAIGLPLGQAIGRWGNFLNKEIVGKNGEPLFIYESIASFILFLIIYKLRDKRRGKLFGIYLLGYGIIRLALEGFRNQSDAWIINGVSVSQILSIVSIVIGLIVLSSRTRFGIDPDSSPG